MLAAMPQLLNFNFAFFISEIRPAPVQLCTERLEKRAAVQFHQTHGMFASFDRDGIAFGQFSDHLAIGAENCGRC